jgi:hypothetical protein
MSDLLAATLAASELDLQLPVEYIEKPVAQRGSVRSGEIEEILRGMSDNECKK